MNVKFRLIFPSVVSVFISLPHLEWLRSEAFAEGMGLTTTNNEIDSRSSFTTANIQEVPRSSKPVVAIRPFSSRTQSCTMPSRTY